MDATSWGINQDEAAFVTNGLWIGISNGTVTIPENLVGDSRPDMGQGGAPPGSVVPPSISNETDVDSGSFSWDVNVFFGTDVEMVAYGNDGIVPVLPSDLSYNIHRTITCFVAGLIVGPGDLIATDGNGSIPLDSNGSLVTVGATVINSDLFS
jgi:hypothetical protein